MLRSRGRSVVGAVGRLACDKHKRAGSTVEKVRGDVSEEELFPGAGADTHDNEVIVAAADFTDLAEDYRTAVTRALARLPRR